MNDQAQKPMVVTAAIQPAKAYKPAVVEHQPNFFALSPKVMIEKASEMATILSDVIEKQKLFQPFNGKKYVIHEGWATLGSILGILPREKEVRELPDGSFEAYVELYSIHTGQIVGQGSALCGMDERNWKSREKYARRSMAVTRATGKAYRLGFSWIMSLAGYAPTPYEEMPEEVKEPKGKDNGHSILGQETQKIFNATDPEHLKKLETSLTQRKIPAELHEKIAADMHEKPFTKEALEATLKTVTV